MDIYDVWIGLTIHWSSSLNRWMYGHLRIWCMDRNIQWNSSLNSMGVGLLRTFCTLGSLHRVGRQGVHMHHFLAFPPNENLLKQKLRNICSCLQEWQNHWGNYSNFSSVLWILLSALWILKGTVFHHGWNRCTWRWSCKGASLNTATGWANQSTSTRLYKWYLWPNCIGQFQFVNK